MSVKVTSIDKGYNRLKKEFGELTKGQYIAVGVYGSGAEQDHGGLTNVEVASFNEFGTERIPARPFISQTVDKNEAKYVKLARALTDDMMVGTITTDYMFARFGEQVVADIKNAILDREFLPNAPSTIFKKGSDTPLVDKGQLLGSISHEVRKQ